MWVNMSANDILKDSSLVAIICAIMGLLIIFGGTLGWLGVIFLGAIAVFFGLINYLGNKKDKVALIATVIGIIVIIAVIVDKL